MSLKDKAYHNLKFEITIGKLKPGSFLTEEKLSKKMNMSRGPIREALNKLEEEEFVSIIPRRGTMVSNITAQEVKDISKIREILEPLTVKENLSKISIPTLKKIKQEFLMLLSKPENSENNQRFFELDEIFHKLLYEKCSNKKLIGILNDFEDHMNWFINLFLKNYSFKQSIKEHLAIIEAIELNKGDLVEANLLKHLERVKNNILSELGQ